MSDGLIRTLFGIPVVLLVMFSLAALLSLALHRLSAWAGDWPTFALRFPAAGRAAGGEEWLYPDRVDVKLSPQSVTLDPLSVVVELTVSLQGFGGVPLGLAGKNVNAINLFFRRRVPWHDVASVTEQRRLSMFTGVRVAFREVPHVLHVRGAAGHALSSNCPSELLVRR